MQFRADIQGLRAIAVLTVLLFHINASILPGGFIGVDIFFVISGFLISSIILNKKSSGTFNFKDFYIGRIKRIMPAYLFFLIVIFVVGTFIFFSHDIFFLRDNIFWAVLFNSNNYLATLDTYFGASSNENPMLHTWTLSIEMQFYFLLPFLLFFIKRKYLTLVIIIITVLLFGYSYYNSTFLSNKHEMYFSLLARIPEFLFGTIIALNQRYFTIKKKAVSNILSIIGVIIIIMSAVLINQKANFPGLLVVLPCLGASLLILTKDSFFNKKVLSNKYFVHIGEISYSFYLWHWGIIALVRYYNDSYQLRIYEIIFVVIATYLISYFSYKYIENYFRGMSIGLLSKRLSIPVVMLGVFAFVLPPLNNKLNENNMAIPDEYSKPIFGMSSHAEEFEAIEIFGDKSIKDSILLLGDSHALIYKRILDNIGKRNNFSFSTITNNGYPTIPGIESKDFDNQTQYKIYEGLINDYVYTAIKKNKIILLSSVWYDLPSMAKAFEDLVLSLNSDQKLIILADYPILDKSPIRINRSIIRKNKNNNNYIATVKPVPQEIKNIADRYNNVFLMDYDIYKLSKASSNMDIPFNSDTIMYYDEGHLNLYGSDVMSELIDKEFIKQFTEIVNTNFKNKHK